MQFQLLMPDWLTGERQPGVFVSGGELGGPRGTIQSRLHWQVFAASGDQNFFPGRVPFYQGTFQKGLQFQQLTFGAPRALKITRRGKASRGSL
ncbi:MAG: hypothetical protein DMG31_13190 [Acidobacteria bacterium]|nr:MAG: hypothetical protein DMG31_13190 [Acidobacteriota bacterium]